MIMTCVERKSGYFVAAKMKDGTSARLNAAKERAFRSVPQKLRQTLTVDNGNEFAGHERLSQRLKMTIYFAHPYSSNERATNENTNGLLRQYFAKKTDFREISHRALSYETERLNNRPRKRLNYLTPLETLNKAGFALQMSIHACTYLIGWMTHKQVQWDCIMFVDMPYRPFVILAITLPRAI